MYQRYLDGDETVEQTPQDEDPFWDPPKDVLIGTSSAFLQVRLLQIDSTQAGSLGTRILDNFFHSTLSAMREDSSLILSAADVEYRL